MINQYEVPAYLVLQLPEINKDLKTVAPSLNIFKTMQCLTSYTKALVKTHDLKGVRKAMNTAEAIYQKGTQEVKNALENIFVYAFTSMMCMCDRNEKNELQAIIPLHLYSAYIMQVYRSGN